MRSQIALLASAALATTASAQSGSYIWQLSEDNGTTWNSMLLVPNNTVKVRLLATWSGVSGPNVANAGAQFDVILTAAEGRVGTVSNIVRPFPFQFAAQTLAASEFSGGTLVKIDTAADHAAPGAGTGWVNPGQPNFEFSGGATYVNDNPVVIFTFDLAWDGHATEIGMVLNAASGRAMAIYSTATGSTVRLNAPNVSVIPARIEIPTPATATVLGLAPLVARRRRG